MGDAWKFFFAFLAPVFFVWVIFIIPGDTDNMLGRYWYMLAVVGSFWLSNVIPDVIAGYLILVFLPLLKLQAATYVGDNVMKEQTMLIMGQMILGNALVFCGLHKKMALLMLHICGNSHLRIVTLLYVTTIVWAGVLSSVTTVSFTLAVVYSLAEERESLAEVQDGVKELASKVDLMPVAHESQTSHGGEPQGDGVDPGGVKSSEENQPEIEAHEPEPKEKEGNNQIISSSAEDVRPEALEVPMPVKVVKMADLKSVDNELKRRYLIVLYIAANIGGLLFPHSSTGVSLLYDFYDNRQRNVIVGRTANVDSPIPLRGIVHINLTYNGVGVNEVTVLHWLLFSVPVVLAVSILVWLYLLVTFLAIRPLPGNEEGIFRTRPEKAKMVLKEEQKMYLRKLSQLDRLDIQQILIMAHVGAVCALCLSRDPRFFQGWCRGIASKVGDSAICFLFLVLMFIIPKFKNKGCQMAGSEASVFSGVDSKGPSLVKSIRSHIHLLQTKSSTSNSYALLYFTVSIFMLLGGEIWGGTACEHVFLLSLGLQRNYTVGGGASKASYHIPGYKDFRYKIGALSLSVGALSGLCFMFPVATSTNSMVFSAGSLSGILSQWDMIKYGVIPDVISYIVVSFFFLVYDNSAVFTG